MVERICNRSRSRASYERRVDRTEASQRCDMPKMLSTTESFHLDAKAADQLTRYLRLPIARDYFRRGLPDPSRGSELRDLGGGRSSFPAGVWWDR